MESVRFDRAVAFYDATRGYSPGSAERICDAIVACTGATHQTPLLEMGVGTGRIALPFLSAGYRYVGGDLSRPMLNVLSQKLSGASRPSLVEGDVSRLPFADASFAVVLGIHILHLVAHWRAVLHEVHRVLCRPGGQLLLGWDSGPAGQKEEATPPPLAQAQ